MNNIHFGSLNLHTNIVVEIVRSLKGEPKLAFLFFNQLKTTGFQHNVSTYVMLISILCSRAWKEIQVLYSWTLLLPSKNISTLFLHLNF